MTKAEKIFKERIVENLGMVTGSERGIHAIEYRISDRTYKGKDMFSNYVGTNIVRITYLDDNKIDEQNSFTRWFLEEVYNEEDASGSGKKKSLGKSEESSGGGFLGGWLFSDVEDDSEPVPMSAEECAMVEANAPKTRSCLQVLLAVIFPPLAVLNRGCGSVMIVFLLTLLGWVPGVIAALIILNKNA